MAKSELDTRFSEFGTVSFASVTRVNDFIGHLQNGKLMGARCVKCGKNFFPPRAQCHDCLTAEMEWFEVTGAGKLVSYSTLQYAPTGFTDEVPYTIALVDYGAYKVFGRIDGSVPRDDLAVGMTLKAAVSRTANGQLTYVFNRA
ncbi:MAG: Zn-ribbon domain-containing OB-fold protein [Syntrophobacteraceae bacterium]|nr:Zn-ribbon domain-containing OB-fold protein [Syntrophobacteraceae bacterium]